jgi:hypothetical protein
MKRYLPEALFFASAAAMLAVLRLDAFGLISEYVLIVLLVCLGMYHGAVPVTLVVAALALKFKHRGAAAVAPMLGVALVISAFFLRSTVDALRAVPRMTDFYWGGLGIVPIVAIGFFVAARVRADRKAAAAYAGGVLLLTACYFVTPWASDVVLMLVKGPSLQTELSKSRTHEEFAVYDYTYGLLDVGQESLLVYDPTDTTTNRVLARFKQHDHCGLRGFRIIGSYYAISYVVELAGD